MKSSTLLLLITVLVGWGFWGFFSKLAAQKIGHQILLWNSMIAFCMGAVYLLFVKQLVPIKFDTPGTWFAMLSGFSIAIGSIAYYILLKRGAAGIVVTTSALYPIITIILSFIFLGEKITLSKGIGFVLALIALFLLNL